MSKHPDNSNYELLEEEDRLAASKVGVYVDSQALISDGAIKPIYGVLKSRGKQLFTAWSWVLASALFYAWTISFDYMVLISDNPVPHIYDFSPANVIFVINIASHASVSLATQETGMQSAAGLFFSLGPHQKWAILRVLIAGLGQLIGLGLLSHVTFEYVYNIRQTFPVIAGIAPLHDSIMAVYKTAGISSTSAITPADVNMMMVGMTQGILTDPKLVMGVAPISCQESDNDCRSIFLPGGMELIRRPDNSPLFAGQQLTDPVIIVHDSPGYQVEFSPANFTFNNSTDCNNYGMAVSSLYACVAFSNNTLFVGFSLCPFANMYDGTCESDSSWVHPLAANVSMHLYQRNATVAYDISNFSILSIESIGDPVNAVNQDLVSDYHTLFKIMYPDPPSLESIIEGAVKDILNFDPKLILQGLEDWFSVYSVQSELFSTLWVLQHGFPNWADGPRDVLEGFLTIPIQFGTVLWQFSNFSTLPSNLHTNASTADVSFRPRSAPWTLYTFAGIAFALVLWGVSCLLYVQFMTYGKNEAPHSTTIDTAFQNGNPFDSKAKARGKVVARGVSKGGLVATDPSDM